MGMMSWCLSICLCVCMCYPDCVFFAEPEAASAPIATEPGRPVEEEKGPRESVPEPSASVDQVPEPSAPVDQVPQAAEEPKVVPPSAVADEPDSFPDIARDDDALEKSASP